MSRRSLEIPMNPVHGATPDFGGPANVLPKQPFLCLWRERRSSDHYQNLQVLGFQKCLCIACIANDIWITPSNAGTDFLWRKELTWLCYFRFRRKLRYPDSFICCRARTEGVHEQWNIFVTMVVKLQAMLQMRCCCPCVRTGMSCIVEINQQ